MCCPHSPGGLSACHQVAVSALSNASFLSSSCCLIMTLQVRQMLLKCLVSREAQCIWLAACTNRSPFSQPGTLEIQTSVSSTVIHWITAQINSNDLQLSHAKLCRREQCLKQLHRVCSPAVPPFASSSRQGCVRAAGRDRTAAGFRLYFSQIFIYPYHLFPQVLTLNQPLSLFSAMAVYSAIACSGSEGSQPGDPSLGYDWRLARRILLAPAKQRVM